MLLTLFMILFWVGIACIADVFFKNAAGFTDPKFLVGVFLYAACGILALLTFRRIEFGALIILWMAMSLLVGLLISVFYYHEKFTVPMAISAVLTIIAAALIGGK